MELNEKHLQHIDNLIKYIMRSRPPKDSVGEEMLALAHSFYFLQELKKVATQTMQQKKMQDQALASIAQQPQSPTENVSTGLIPKSKNKKSGELS
jgi:hypothetical protein